MTEITSTGYYYRGSFVARIINGVVGIIEVFLFVRLVLELFGANSSSQFVAWIYSVSGAFIGPFAGAFSGISLGGNSVLDIVAIFAMIGYAIIGWLVIELVAFMFGTMKRI
ncbi:MAG: YggT family protein [Candidatus Adlerbacteria bacterium]|nr:YggT family protein [Candidatus Adlerbacteria bacterium]